MACQKNNNWPTQTSAAHCHGAAVDASSSVPAWRLGTPLAHQRRQHAVLAAAAASQRVLHYASLTQAIARLHSRSRNLPVTKMLHHGHLPAALHLHTSPAATDTTQLRWGTISSNSLTHGSCCSQACPKHASSNVSCNVSTCMKCMHNSQQSSVCATYSTPHPVTLHLALSQQGGCLTRCTPAHSATQHALRSIHHTPRTPRPPPPRCWHHEHRATRRHLPGPDPCTLATLNHGEALAYPSSSRIPTPCSRLPLPRLLESCSPMPLTSCPGCLGAAWAQAAV